MRHALHLQLLAETRQELESSLGWLQRSVEKCSHKGLRNAWSADDFDAFEAFTSRFARVSDILLQKFFRALDVVELSEGGTLLDVLLRAEKRGLVESADKFLEIRELRNEISHEYATDDLPALFEAVLQKAPELIATVERSMDYADTHYLGS